MGLTDRIEAFITELLKNEEEEWLEIGRNELAEIFGCVPSQINYVIATRFKNGYAVESRRGGGGCIRIKQLSANDNVYRKLIDNIADFTDYPDAKQIIDYLKKENCLSDGEYSIMTAAISDSSIPISQPEKNRIRAAILKNIISAKAL